MTDFLATYHLQGLVLGLCSFLIIGICHPIVIKGEYRWGQRMKWFFLVVGIVLCAGSLLVENVLAAATPSAPIPGIIKRLILERKPRNEGGIIHTVHRNAVTR